jgi:hypothetical protein
MPPISIHLCLVQPGGAVEALALLDAMRRFRQLLRERGAQVSLAQNRLRHDACNVVFGAHQGFDPTLADRLACVFANLQAWDSPATLPPDYRDLLARHAVIDTDGRLQPGHEDVAIVPPGPFPGLATPSRTALAARPARVLVIGAAHDRTDALVQRLRALGQTAQPLDPGLCGSARDELIAASQAVVTWTDDLVHGVDQYRAAHCLSLGTPVIAIGPTPEHLPDALRDGLILLGDAALDDFMRHEFARLPFHFDASERLAAFDAHDPRLGIEAVWALCQQAFEAIDRSLTAPPWQARRLHAGPPEAYRLGWLNIAPADASADLAADLAAPLTLPVTATTARTGPIELAAGSLLQVAVTQPLAAEVPPTREVSTLLDNALRLLHEDGLLEIDLQLPAWLAASADPPAVCQALATRLHHRWCHRFWDHHATLTHRFEWQDALTLDADGRPCPIEAADRLRVQLRKVATTPGEQALARTTRPDLGGLPADDTLFNLGVPSATAGLSITPLTFDDLGMLPAHDPGPATRPVTPAEFDLGRLLHPH